MPDSDEKKYGHAEFDGGFPTPSCLDGVGEYHAPDGVVYDANRTEIESVPDDLSVLVIPATVKGVRGGSWPRLFALKEIRVEEGNRSFASSGGMLFNADMTELLLTTAFMEGICRIPASVKRIASGVIHGWHPSLRAFEVDFNSETFRSVDGLLYTRDMKRLVACPQGWEGYLSIPEGVEHICADCFDDCEHLVGIRFPASVTDIHGCLMLSHCDGLKSIDVDGSHPCYRSEDGVLFNRDMTKLIRFPVGKTGCYVVPETVKSLGDHAFYGCKNLERIEVPSSVTSVGRDPFCACEDRVVWKRSGELTEGAFRYAADGQTAVLTGVDDTLTGTFAIPRMLGGLPVTGIGDLAFEKNRGVLCVLIPDAVVDIADNAFCAFPSLEEIRVAENNPRYQSYDGMLFDRDGRSLVWCPTGKAGTARIPASLVTGIRHGHFFSCSGLTAFDVDPGNPVFCSVDGVLMDKGMTEIVRCPEGKVGEFRVPVSVETIWEDAFSGSNLSCLIMHENKMMSLFVQLYPPFKGEIMVEDLLHDHDAGESGCLLRKR